MQLRARLAAVALALPLLATGCDLPGLASDMERASSGGNSGAGDSWTVVAEGRPTASPTPRAPSPKASPSRKPFVAAESDPHCAFAWSAGQVVIPLTVVPAVNSAIVSWPRTGNPAPASYRLAAVPQRLVTGEQPSVEWRTVTATPGCMTTTRVTGLISGESYVFWLDAPDSGYQPDGTPRPTHGRSDVFEPL